MDVEKHAAVAGRNHFPLSTVTPTHPCTLPTVHHWLPSTRGRFQDTSSQSFSRNEVFLAIHCLQQAVARIIEEQQVQSHGAQEEAVM